MVWASTWSFGGTCRVIFGDWSSDKRHICVRTMFPPFIWGTIIRFSGGGFGVTALVPPRFEPVTT